MHSRMHINRMYSNFLNRNSGSFSNFNIENYNFLTKFNYNIFRFLQTKQKWVLLFNGIALHALNISIIRISICMWWQSTTSQKKNFFNIILYIFIFMFYHNIESHEPVSCSLLQRMKNGCIVAQAWCKTQQQQFRYIHMYIESFACSQCKHFSFNPATNEL